MKRETSSDFADSSCRQKACHCYMNLESDLSRYRSPEFTLLRAFDLCEEFLWLHSHTPLRFFFALFHGVDIEERQKPASDGITN